MATMTLKKTQTGTMKAQLEDILMAVSWSELSRMPLATEGTQERLTVRSATISGPLPNEGILLAGIENTAIYGRAVFLLAVSRVADCGRGRYTASFEK